MAGMLLVNPRKRRKSRGRKKASTRVRRRKVTTRRRRRAAPVARRPSRRRNPIRMHRRARRRHNPLGLNLNSVKSQVMDSAIGAGGAVVLDIALSYLPVPASLKSGAAAPLIKGAAAIALGMLASKVVNSSTAAKMTGGALTVMLHGIIRASVAKALPNVQMGDWDGDDFESDGLQYYGSGENPALGEYLQAYGADTVSDNMGEYLAGDFDAAAF